MKVLRTSRRAAACHEPQAVAKRFWSKVDTSAGANGCWPWTASLGSTGYGQFELAYRMRKAHQVAYELSGRCVPAGLHLDHLCRNRRCVNPAHLEPVTPAENTRRGLAAQVKAHITHCPQGHPYDGNNTLWAIRDGRRSRRCRECHNADSRIRQARLRATRRAHQTVAA